MAGFEELGKKLDKLRGEIKTAAQDGIERTAKEAKDWRKKLDGLGKIVRKTTQEGVEWFSKETKEFGEVNRLRLQIRRVEKDMNDLFEQTGRKAYELHLQKKIGNIQLKSLGAKITRLKKEMETKKKRIQNLKKRS
ncbi:hypothetical protein LCGC14_2689990 [marine sediment metagenome]|uniref:Uncharacterized protein n=1 Tax=marine sediment metagenome TaxID=412755 RepID=A0A0F9CAH8_9ZZZZ